MSDMPVRYQLDINNFYVGLAEIEPDPEQPGEWLIPGNTVDVEPPPPMDGYKRWWNGTEWEYVPIPDDEYQYPEPTEEQILETKRGEAIAALDEQLTTKLYGVLLSRPNGPDTLPERYYPLAQTDQLKLMMSANQAMSAGPTWTTKLRCRDISETLYTSKTHNAMQVLQVASDWSDFNTAAQEEHDAKVELVNSATTLAELEAIMQDLQLAAADTGGGSTVA